MNKHTPGPWQAIPSHPARENDSEIVVEQAGGSAPLAICRPIYTTASGRGQLEANARLVAAAPDLLRYLALLVDAVGRMPSNAADGIADEARQVIAAATLGRR